MPAAYRATWGSNDVAGNAPGSPTYGGYGWRWCTTGDAALECERFCDSLPDCAGKTPATARRSPTPRSSMSHTALADVPSSRADRGVAAISAGQCCFPYRRRCPRSQLSDKSSSQSYKYYERDKPPGWGWPFLGALLLAAAAYAGGGVAASRVAGGGRGASGAQTHPHYQHWVGLRALVADGIAYAAGRRRSGDGGGGVGGNSGRRRVVVLGESAERIGAGGGGGGGGGGSLGGGGGPASPLNKESQKKTKQVQKEKQERRKKKERQDQSGSAGGGGSLDAPLTGAVAAAETAAGGGGRWVHVPS